MFGFCFQALIPNQRTFEDSVSGFAISYFNNLFPIVCSDQLRIPKEIFVIPKEIFMIGGYNRG